MAYNLRFQVDTPGVENLAKVRAEVLGLQEQYKAASSEVKQAINRISDAEKQAAEAIALGHKNLAAGIMAGVQQDNEALDSLIRKELELKAAIEQVSGAHTHNVSQVAAASAAIREFEGALPIRAVERFAVTTLGLGPILQAAFPIFGAIALGEVIVKAIENVVKLAEKWDPVTAATKRAKDAVEEYGKSVDTVRSKLQGFQDKEFERIFGKSSGKANEASQLSDAAGAKLRQAGALEILLSRAEKELAEAQSVQVPHYAGEALGGNAGRTNQIGRISQAKSDVEALRAQISGLQNEASVLEAHAHEKFVESAGAQEDINKRRDKKDESEGIRAQKRIDQETISLRNELANLQAKELTGLDAINAKRNAMLEHLREEKKLNAENVDLVNQIAVVEGRLGFEKAARAGHEGAVRLASQAVGQESRDEGRATSFNSRIFSEALKKAIVEGEKEVATDRKVIAAYTATEVDEVTQRTRSVIRNNQRDVKSGMIGQGPAAASDYNAQVAAANEIFEIEKRRIDLIDDENKREEELATAKKRNAEDIFRAQEQYEDQLQAIRRKSQEDYKQFIVGLTDAAIGGKAGQFLQNFGRQQLDKIVGNVADLTFNSVKGLAPRVPGQINDQGQMTTLGHVLSGTVFGPDQLAGATTSNTAATVANTAATTQLATVIAGGGTAGVGGIGTSTSGLGSIFGGGSTQNPFVFNATGTPNLPFVDGASDINNLSGASTNATRGGGGGGFGIMSGLSHTGDLAGIFTGVGAHETLNTQERIGAGIGTAGVLIGGGMAAFSQFKRGGASGILGGIGASAGTAAALDPEPISKAVLGGVALVSGIISSILPDPKKVREEAIQKAIEQGHYNAPESLSVSQDTSGHYYDMNSRGQIRGSNLSSMPQVNEPYTFWKGNTPYQVPGSVTSPYGSPTINIYAHDSQSFVDMARRNASGLGDVIADHVQNEGSRLSAAIAYRVNR